MIHIQNETALERYGSSGKYLFHGSSKGDIREFEPRQAYSFGKADGSPAVFAATHIEPAIFMAILGSRHVGGMGKPDVPEYGFYIQQSDWEKAQAENWNGYVYVMPKNQFTERTPGEWVSTSPVKPIDVRPVSFSDLPPHIEVLTDAAFGAYYDAHQGKD